MGRLTNYLAILICIDILFTMLGFTCVADYQCSFTSSIYSMILHPDSGSLSTWFSTLIGSVTSLLSGNTSQGTIGYLLSLAATAGVAVGSIIFGLKNDSVLFAGTGLALSLLVGDFITIYTYLAISSPETALLTMSPVIVLYVFTCLEWVRGIQ